MNQSYKTLRDKWYEKLKKSGFKDIEDVNSPNEMLIDWHSSWFHSNTDRLHFKCKHRYFMMCEHFLGSHKFKNQVERRMWRLHADGLSIREIAKAMGSTRDKVDYALKRLKKIMRRGY